MTMTMHAVCGQMLWGTEAAAARRGVLFRAQWVVPCRCRGRVPGLMVPQPPSMVVGPYLELGRARASTSSHLIAHAFNYRRLPSACLHTRHPLRLRPRCISSSAYPLHPALTTLCHCCLLPVTGPRYDLSARPRERERETPTESERARDCNVRVWLLLSLTRLWLALVGCWGARERERAPGDAST